MADKIKIDGLEIAVKQVNEEDYVSLTDMAKTRVGQRAADVIRAWIRNANTLLFLEQWEIIFNPSFKGDQMITFKAMSIDNRLDITPKKFVEMTDAISIEVKSGRYGGTYAHVDIALEFASWLDPKFKVFFIRDYQRLKLEEQKQIDAQWTFSRFLSKVNYQIHTQSI